MSPQQKPRQSPTLRSCRYRCDRCRREELIPDEVLAYFDEVDPDDLGSPATFQCEHCPGIMYPHWWFHPKGAAP
jgi:hypothetical protein